MNGELLISMSYEDGLIEILIGLFESVADGHEIFKIQLSWCKVEESCVHRLPEVFIFLTTFAHKLA